ncbi:phytanoyl-CoA dioxygenase family protein [Pelagibius sp. Alg239-R121]|uniref:phytanoyl-CoA dioxygenase family protein n=1 Tax=Pelagibius sp. Alg239-R121 TaxID=2993448 RepID=UPI0024A736DD|nr:phytanoyl-CoA dioxygenase family protein [Pelagibius sp. Alg239-R121]
MTPESKLANREAFEREGYQFPIQAMTAKEAAGYRAQLEAHETLNGGPLQSNMRHQTHFLFTWAYELVHNPKILDAVEAVIGPDILCWATNFFIKEAKDGNYVSWHQDATYWGLEPTDKIVTAWLALSEASVENGAMKFLAGSHRSGQQPHKDTFHENNLLSRGQEVEVEVDEDRATDVTLSAGEFSLHHVLLAHGSHPNHSDGRRIGFAIRYIPTSARQTKLRDAAVLVRGVDNYSHFDLLPGPEADLDEAALATHADSTQRLIAAVYEGTGKTELRA